MRLTLKSIIVTILNICTVATGVYACILGVTVYHYLNTPVQIPHGRLQQLEESYSSLHDNIAYHQTHVTGPFTKALLDQMTAVTTQISDLAVDLGCADQNQVKHICRVLMLEELRLKVDILADRMEWLVDAEEKEVEGHIDAEKEEVKTQPLSEQEHGGWTSA